MRFKLLIAAGEGTSNGLSMQATTKAASTDGRSEQRLVKKDCGQRKQALSLSPNSSWP